MKIEYLKLKNYIGIYNGMETNEIEIDFKESDNVITLLSGKNGSGKAQPEDSIVYTPSGYKRIGDIKVGDIILSENGEHVRVNGVFPQGLLEVYRVHFNDGTYMDCNDEHLFKVTIDDIDEEVCTVRHILTNMNDHTFTIPTCSNISFNEQEVSISPHEVGKNINEYFFIPKEYMYNTIDKRQELLSGILENGNTITNDNVTLLEDIRFIVDSLGMSCSLTDNTITINTNKQCRTITNVEYLNMMVQMVCISIDSESHLYLTNNFIVTHNTTVLSTLHPFSGTMDGRGSFILEGTEGFKEIHISHNDTLYKIEHHYDNKGKSMKVKSYISKKSNNDSSFKQLNPNGTVKSFKELIFKNLDVDESFFNLARIGSDTAGFIDKTPAKRKEYLSMFLSDIDRFLVAYKKINASYSSVNKNIKYIVDQINKLEDEDRLNDRLKNLSNQIEDITNIRNEQQSLLDSNIGESKALDPEGNLYDKYQEGLKEYNLKKHNLGQYQVNMNKHRQMFTDVDSFSDELSKVKTEKQLLEQRLEKEKDNLLKLNSEILDVRNDIFDIHCKISEFGVDKTVSDYQELIDTYNTQLDELNTYIESNKDKYSKYDNIDLTVVKDAQIRLDKVVQQIDNVISKYNMNTINEINEFDPISTKERIINLKNMIHDYEEQLLNLRSNEASYNANLKLVKVLDKRPSDCAIDSCPFISEALLHVNDREKLNQVQNKIAALVNSIRECNNELSSIDETISLYNQLQTIYSSNIEDMSSTFNLLPHPHHFNSYNNFIANLTKDKSLIDFSDIIEYKTILNDISSLNDKIVSIKKELDNSEKILVLLDTMKSNQERLEERESLLVKDIGNLESDIKAITSDIQEIDNEIIVFTKCIEDEEQIESTTREINEIREYLKSIKSKVQRIKDITEDNTKINEAVVTYDRQLVNLNKDLDNVKFSMERLREYKERKSELDDRFFKLSTLRTALSTTKGIPLLFIDVYLKKTKKIANELLDIIFKGNFYIEDFKLTESDFLISVRKPDGEIVEDVTGASQGEKALISIALSFALIQQSLRKYNILCLDEMDATLDANNRRSFIDMIERQLKVMGVEQCFIISHNEAFDPHPVDLLLFPNSTVDKNNNEFMENKKIIADFM